MNDSAKLEAVITYVTDCAAAIEEAVTTHGGPSESDLICFFLKHNIAEDEEKWGLENQSIQLAKPLLEASPLKDGLCLVGGTVGIDASERCFPTFPYIIDRSLLLFEIAEKSRMSFIYWQYEPLGKINWSGANLDEVYSANVSSEDFKTLIPHAIARLNHNAQLH